MYTHFLDTKKIIGLNTYIMNTLKQYDFSDVSYGNDCCNSMAYGYNESEFYFTIYLPNSKNQDYDQEKHNTYFIMLVAPNLYIDSLYEEEFNNLENALGFILSNPIIKEKRSIKND